MAPSPDKTERPPSLTPDGSHNVLYPAEVKGTFRSWRNLFYLVLLCIFLVLPFFKVGGHQAVLLSIPERRFAFFGLTFFAHDVPMIFLISATIALALAFVTALWGRIWCGWACPQIVFVEAVYRKIEYVIQGDYKARKKLAQGPWTGEKIIKVGLTWAGFIGVSLLFSHSFLAYFVGTERLGDMVRSNPLDNWTPFLIMAFVTAVVAFDFGWFREQFCLIMCPYGRIQSVLMDEDTVTVAYDARRGEPRGKTTQSGVGDCVHCFACVRVCPTGIDIRDGAQMECVACTACIDACDNIMDKLQKPRGLIRYAAARTLEGGKAGIFRVRTLIYLVLLGVCVFGVVQKVTSRQDIEVVVLRAPEAPYQLVKGNAGEDLVINHFKLQLTNQSAQSQTVELSLSKSLRDQGVSLLTPATQLQLQAGQDRKQHFFLKFPRHLTDQTGTHDVHLQVTPFGEGPSTSCQTKVRLIGPVD